MNFNEYIIKSNTFNKIENALKEKGRISLNGATLSFSAALFSLLSENNHKFVYVASNSYKVNRIVEDLTFFSGNKSKIITLEPYEYMLYDVESKSSEISAKRVNILYKILTNSWNILVTTPTTLAQWLPNPKFIENSAISLKVGNIIEIKDLIEKLIKAGYIKVPEIDGKGQFSVRGDIVDIYSQYEENPIRIEFFDNEIDSLRNFDIITQRTIENVEKVTVLPDKETYIWNWEHADNVRNSIKNELKNMNIKESSQLYQRINDDIDNIMPRNFFKGYDRYLSYILGNKYTLFDYVGKCNLIFDSEVEFKENIDASREDIIRICNSIQENTGIIPGAYNLMMTSDYAMDICNKNALNIIFNDEFIINRENCKKIDILCRSTTPFGGNLQMLFDSVSELAENNYTVYLITESEGKKIRFETLKEENKLHYNTKIIVSKYGLSSGFVCDEEKYAIICDDSLFKKEKSRTKKKLKGKAISSFADIEPGTLVVHEVHGVGRFEKIESVETDGIRRDYIKINYRDDGILYVPTPQLDSLQKYIGPEGLNPKLNKLGSAEWNKTTSKVKDSLRTYAKELVELYAKRLNIKGYSYSKDTVWQKEFEEYFPYNETDDQIRCTEEIKSDLEKSYPMERLLCGDVGYGKTEVALRAAFKVVCEGKQVAFLVPTTVLAQQHYKNFIERFKNFPIKIDYLCRFRTPAEKRKVLKEVEYGKIDILVGTHSIIKGSVKFKDLGLVVIDEEQRFGVMHKEKLKKDRPEVDILTLSATPIPRTLHMSLSGIRDISILEEPPQNRIPVQTYVAEWEPNMIKNAIYREMGRKGQIFYLYNKVRTIEEKRRQIQELVPEARIAVGHGQMGERELEAVIEAFYKGEYDILLCTTIIESGIDIPNVNTIIIEESDHMGLAQLYQIRGRVGRSGKSAYAYVTYKKDKTLNEVAEKRLRTIRDFTEFGSGFKIALRDLEIRGAGSVLGEKQHGQLAVVGYETYCRLLNEVVGEEAGILPENKAVVSVDIKVNGYIGQEYIEDEEARLDMYQKISRVETKEDAYEVIDELIDRYGEVPDNVNNLIKISQIRYLCYKTGIDSVIEKQGNIQFMINEEGKAFYAMMHNLINDAKFLREYANRVKFMSFKEPYLLFKCKNNDKISEIIAFLEEITKFYHCKNCKTNI